MIVTGHDDLPISTVQGDRDFHAPTGSASVHLNAMRALAAISVMYSHWWDAFFANYEALPPHSPLLVLMAAYYCKFAHAWVIVFFVLSGYLVGGSVLRARSDGKWCWRSYLLVRCTRIYVVLVPALLLGGALDWAGMHQAGAETIYSGHSGMGSLYWNAYASLTPTTLVQSLVFLRSGAPGFGSHGPLWSLSHEFWYYMGFPILVIAVSKQQRIWSRAVSVIALIAWAGFAGGYIVSLFPVWLAGVSILFLPALTKTPPWNRAWAQRLLISVSLILLMVGFSLKAQGLLFPDNSVTVGRSHWHPLISDILLSPFVALVIWVILECARRPLSKAYVWIAGKAADSSYTLYLVHFPAFVFLKSSLHLPRMVPTLQSLPFNVSLLLMVFLYAQLVYWLFERNTDRIRQWMKPFVMGQNNVGSKARPSYNKSSSMH